MAAAMGTHMETLSTTDRLANISQNTPSGSYDPGAPVRILFVEDTESDFHLMWRQLTRAKFPLASESVRVEDESGMRQALQSRQWDVVISDYRMPRFSAQAAMKLVRASGRDIPFLVVSGAVGEDVAVQSMHDGADDYVMKHNLSRLPIAIGLALQAAAVRREHRQAVESLRASEDYFRTLVAASPVAIVALDKEGRISLFNPAAQALFPELPGLLGDFPKFASVENFRTFQRLSVLMRVGEAFEQQPAQWELADQRSADLLFSAAPLRPSNAEVDGVVLFVVDVTAQKKAEAARRDSESRVAAISANLPGVLFRMVFQAASGKTLVPYISPGATALFGVEPDQFVSESTRFMTLFDSTAQEEIRTAVAESLRTGNSLQGNWRIQRPDGAERWIQMSASVQPGVDGDPVFDGVITDLSEQKRTEAELTQSREELRRLTAHMETLKEEERREVAREIHDDIGSTLAGLKADAMWLRKRLGNDPAIVAKLTDMSALIDGAVQTANRIISSLRPGILDYGIGPALEWQLNDFGARMGVSVSFKTNQEDIAMDLGQSTALFRVLQESLTNVAKHAHANRVDVELFANPSSVTLEIRDDGIGLKQADLAKASSFGLRGMMERIRSLGGWLDVNGVTPGGTILMASIPRRQGANGSRKDTS